MSRTYSGFMRTPSGEAHGGTLTVCCVVPTADMAEGASVAVEVSASNGYSVDLEPGIYRVFFSGPGQALPGDSIGVASISPDSPEETLLAAISRSADQHPGDAPYFSPAQRPNVLRYFSGVGEGSGGGEGFGIIDFGGGGLIETGVAGPNHQPLWELTAEEGDNRLILNAYNPGDGFPEGAEVKLPAEAGIGYQFGAFKTNPSQTTKVAPAYPGKDNFLLPGRPPTPGPVTLLNRHDPVYFCLVRIESSGNRFWLVSGNADIEQPQY